ncbi:uncharacterized protein LOC135690674 isoform X2 [Rhopilema esculentum]|uniref:uncharacterized protein LOC135690674 isoform X2 n=1 Tax=Rhopilema esculentum TaxID=499914 RepID=UPI0031DA6A9C
MEDLLKVSLDQPNNQRIRTEPFRVAEDVFKTQDASCQETKSVVADRQDEESSTFHDLLQTFSQEVDDREKYAVAGTYDNSSSRNDALKSCSVSALSDEVNYADADEFYEFGEKSDEEQSDNEEEPSLYNDIENSIASDCEVSYNTQQSEEECCDNYHLSQTYESDLPTSSETFQHNFQEQSESVYYHISGDQEKSEPIYSNQETYEYQKRNAASDVTTGVNGYNAHRIQEFTSPQNEFDHLDESLASLKTELAEIFRRRDGLLARIIEIKRVQNEKLSFYSKMVDNDYSNMMDELRRQVLISNDRVRGAQFDMEMADFDLNQAHSQLNKEAMNLELFKIGLTQANETYAGKLLFFHQTNRQSSENFECLQAQLVEQRKSFKEELNAKQVRLARLKMALHSAKDKKSLIMGHLAKSREKILKNKLKNDKEFVDVYEELTKKKHINAEMSRALEMQDRMIAGLKEEGASLEEEVKIKEEKLKKSKNKWKRRFLSFFCIRVEED